MSSDSFDLSFLDSSATTVRRNAEDEEALRNPAKAHLNRVFQDVTQVSVQQPKPKVLQDFQLSFKDGVERIDQLDIVQDYFAAVPKRQKSPGLEDWLLVEDENRRTMVKISDEVEEDWVPAMPVFDGNLIALDDDSDDDQDENRFSSDISKIATPLASTVTHCASCLWTHRLVKSYMDRWFPPDSKYAMLRKIGAIEKLPEVIIPIIVHMWRKPIRSILGSLVVGGIDQFRFVINHTQLDQDTRKELLRIGDAFWKGEGTRAQLNKEFDQAKGNLEDEVLWSVQQAKDALFQADEAQSKRDLERDLAQIERFVMDIFYFIERYLEKRARVELDPVDGQQNSVPLQVGPPKAFESDYPKGSLGRKLEKLLFALSGSIQQQFDESFFERGLLEYRAQVGDEATDLLDYLVQHRTEFAEVAARMLRLLMGPLQRFLTRCLENFLKQVLRHDHSRIVETLAMAVGDHLAIYWASRDSLATFVPWNPKPRALLRQMKAKPYQRLAFGLHKRVPESCDSREMRRREFAYFKFSVIPKLEALIFPDKSILQELIQSLVEGDERWEDVLPKSKSKRLIAGAVFESPDAILRHILAYFMVEAVNHFLKPRAINQLIIDKVEEKWQRDIEALDQGSRERDDLEGKWATYQQDKYKLLQRVEGALQDREKEDLYLLSRLAIHKAVDLWSAGGVPGIKALYKGTVGQLHEMVQCTPVIKSLVFHLIDVVLDELSTEPEKECANLTQNIDAINRKIDGKSPFDSDSMQEMARLVLDLLREGNRHLPNDTSGVGWSVLTLAGWLASLKESWAVNWIQGKLDDLWEEKFELSFPGILAVLLEHAEAFFRKPVGGLDDLLKEKAEGLLQDSKDNNKESDSNNENLS